MTNNLEILKNKRTEGKQSDWLKQAKKRQRFALWYWLKFEIVLRWLLIKENFK
jgi:hypothetical protein